MSKPYSHAADDYFESLVDYLHHLVDKHSIEETRDLWRSGRDTFDRLHAEAHGGEGSMTEGDVSTGHRRVTLHRSRRSATSPAKASFGLVRTGTCRTRRPVATWLRRPSLTPRTRASDGLGTPRLTMPGSAEIVSRDFFDLRKCVNANDKTAGQKLSLPKSLKGHLVKW